MIHVVPYPYQLCPQLGILVLDMLVQFSTNGDRETTEILGTVVPPPNNTTIPYPFYSPELTVYPAQSCSSVGMDSVQG